jgi:anthranilate phosphoribosyltransferase
MATLLNRFHDHSQLMSVQNTSILLCVTEFIKHLQYLHVYIKHMHEKCLEKTLAVGLSKISLCRDETLQMVQFTLYKRF